MRLEISFFTITKMPRPGWQGQHRYKLEVRPIGAPEFVIEGMLASEVVTLLFEEREWLPTYETQTWDKTLEWHLSNPDGWYPAVVTFEGGSKNRPQATAAEAEANAECV